MRAFVLKSDFRLLVPLSLTFLAFDFTPIYEEANAPLPGETKQNEPVVMEPPKRQDQLRPYLPLNNPLLRKATARKCPAMPSRPARTWSAAR